MPHPHATRMHPIRLAVSCPVEATWAEIAARVRGAVVEPFQAQVRRGDAAMFVGPVDRELIENLLLGGVPVLLVAEPCPPATLVETLFATARRATIPLAVVNPDRYLPSRQLIRRQLPTAFGEAGLIRLHRWEPATTHQVSDPLVRDLDLTLWLAGRRPDRVFAVEHPSGGYRQVHLGFPGGGMALLDATNRLPPGDGYASLSVIASTGAAYADDHANTQLVFRGGYPQGVRTEERSGQHAAIAQEFVDAVRTGQDVIAPSEAAWREVFAVAAAVVRSLDSGRAVTLEDA